MADRLLAWLEDCGYEIVQKTDVANDIAAMIPDEAVATQPLVQFC